MNLDSVSFDEDRLECLDTEAVKSRSSVQEHVLVLDHVFEHSPHFRDAVVDETGCAADVECQFPFEKLRDDERLEELEGHVLWKSALVELELRTDDDHRSAGVVHALSEKVSSEKASLALEVVRKRFQRSSLRL